MTDQQITFLYRKIEAFVRGFNHLNIYRKSSYVPPAPDQQDLTRKPIIEGGYIMQHKIKREERKQTQRFKPKVVKIDPEQLILEWTEEEERQICILFLDNVNIEFIIENLRAKFGDSDKWKDFQILGKKIDHIIKLGLNRLQQLTVTPYNRIEKMIEQQRRAKIKVQLRRNRLERVKIKQNIRKIEDFKQVIYYSPELKDVSQNGLIKNPSLLLKQVFAHVGQSFRVKQALVHLLVEKYPQQYEIEQTLKVIKDFTEWAAREESTNGVTIIRARLPVLEDDKSKTRSNYDSYSERSFNRMKELQDQAEIAEGLSLIQDEQDSQLIKRQAQLQEKSTNFYLNNANNSLDSNGKKMSANTNQSSGNEIKIKKDVQISKVQMIKSDNEAFIEVYQSQQSQYEGFISDKTANSIKK